MLLSRSKRAALLLFLLHGADIDQCLGRRRARRRWRGRGRGRRHRGGWQGQGQGDWAEGQGKEYGNGRGDCQGQGQGDWAKGQGKGYGHWNWADAFDETEIDTASLTDHQVIQGLMHRRGSIKRSFEKTDTGMCSNTTSDNDQVAEWIERHVEDMKTRFANNKCIRCREPLFWALYQNRKDTEMIVTRINGEDEKGVHVCHNALNDNDCAKDLIQAHAALIEKMVQSGPQWWQDIPDSCL